MEIDLCLLNIVNTNQILNTQVFQVHLNLWQSQNCFQRFLAPEASSLFQQFLQNVLREIETCPSFPLHNSISWEVFGVGLGITVFMSYPQCCKQQIYFFFTASFYSRFAALCPSRHYRTIQNRFYRNQILLAIWKAG